VGEKSYLVASFKGLDSHADCKAISSVVLDKHIAVLYASLIQKELLWQQETSYSDLKTDLIALLAAAFKSIEIFLLRLFNLVLCFLFLVLHLMKLEQLS